MRERLLRDHYLLIREDEVFEVNHTGHEIWSMCDGSSTSAEILRRMRDNHPDTEEGQLRAEIEEFLDAMSGLGVIEWRPSVTPTLDAEKGSEG